MLIPEEFEFWQGNESGLHDRLRFRKNFKETKQDEKPQEENENEVPEEDEMMIRGERGWIIERLAP